MNGPFKVEGRVLFSGPFENWSFHQERCAHSSLRSLAAASRTAGGGMGLLGKWFGKSQNLSYFEAF